MNSVFGAVSRLSFVFATCLVLFGGHAQAAVLLTDASGKLIGAKNVKVGDFGKYDVTFVDGTCIEIYSGCDDAGDFDFTQSEQTIAAGNALLEQVFVHQYDDNPALTFGCTDTEECGAFIPSGAVLGTGIGYVIGTGAVNVAPEYWPYDFLGPTGDFGPLADRDLSTDDSLGTGTYRVWTRWTPSKTVPEPDTVALLGLVLTGLAMARSRQ